MNENQLKYNIQISLDTKNQFKVQFSNIPFPELVRLCLLTIEKAAEKMLDTAPADMQEALASDMYDLINIGTSTLLQRAFPEIDSRPDLTVEAIMEAENKIIDEAPEKVKEAHEAYLASSDFAKDLAVSKKLKKNLDQDKKDALGIKDHKKKGR